MKRNLTFVLSVLALMACLIAPKGMNGQTTHTIGWGTASGNAGTYTNFTAVTGSVSGVLSFSTDKNSSSNAPAYNANASELRLYFASSGDGGSITITPVSGVTITDAVMTTSTTPSIAYYIDGGSAVSVTASNNTYTISGISASTSLEIQNANTTNTQLRIKTIAITYTAGGSQPTTYTVTYNANVAGVSPIVDTYNEGDDVTLREANTFTNEGYTFDEWNTEASGDGDSYAAGDVIEDIQEDIELYAIWTENGGGTGGSTETVTLTQSNLELTGSYTTDTEKTISGITYVYTDLMKSNDNIQAKASSGTIRNTTAYPGDITSVNITHSGTARATTIYGSTDGTNWTQVATGSGSISADFSGEGYKYFKITRGSNAAYWTKIEITYSTIATYSVTYDANGATAGTVPTDATVYDDETNTVTVLGNTGNLAKGGYIWAGWNTQADGNGTNYTAGNTFTISANTTLYAKWNAKTITSLTYTGTPTTTNYYAGQSFDPTGLTVTATFNDNSSENVTSSVVWTPNPLTSGTTSVTGAYMGLTITVNGLTVTAAPGTQDNPYTVAQAIANTPSSGTSSDVYIHGIVSAFYGSNTNITTDSYHRYYISDDGTTTSQLLVFNGKGLDNVAFSNANDLLVGDEVTILGGLTTYNSTKEIAANNYIVSLVRPNQYTLTATMTNVAEYFVFVDDAEIEFDNNNQAQVRAGATVYVSLTMEDCYALTSLTVNGLTTGVTEEEPGVYYSFVMPEGNATIGTLATQATQYTLTVVGGENVSFDMLAGAESNAVSLTNGTATLCEQMFVTIANLTANSGLVLQSVTLTAGGSTTTLTQEYGVYNFNMPSSNATLTFTTATAPTYTLANSIETGKSYIIVGFDGDDAYAMGEQKTSNRAGVGITVDGATAIGNANVHEVVITALEGDDAGKYTIEDGGYLYASSSSSNQLKTESTLDDNGKWTIVFGNDGEATITAQGSNSRKLMRFNPNASNNNPLFACYATTSTTGSLPRLYVKDEAPVTETYTFEIAGYTDVTEGTNNKGYYLIASPVNVDPANVEGMTDGDFDLFYFDQAQEGAEWRNYEANVFDLEPTKGYLYAKKATTETSTYTFELTGIPYNGMGEIELTYTEDVEFAGWNLVGNPFGETAYIDGDGAFYTMNGEGSELEANLSLTSIEPMEGIFVLAEEEGVTITFSTEAPNKSANLALNLTQDSRGIIDRAVVRFGEGRQLPKFQLNPNHTKIYFQQGNKDYAVVRSANEGEMPVSFKAETRGTYTLKVEVNAEMNYLHLIDNLTGNDVDLLATPSYTFEATPADYATRFRLMFSANTVSENATIFAYFNGSEWIVNNDGNATLQVVDVMGRILRNEQVNGNVTLNLNETPGIYMLRLVNGDNVMIQKIVVR